MSIYQNFIAQIYDMAMKKVERLCLHDWRIELLGSLSGDLLEIGAGTGVNLSYYPTGLGRLVLCEPELPMRKKLESRLEKLGRNSTEINSCSAEMLAFEDASFDYVVSTLVLCSVKDPRRALNEIRRILKPGGRLVLMEHVAAHHESSLLFWQEFWQPCWRRFSCNCHLARPTARLLEDSGFHLELREEVMRGSPGITTPMIVGVALSP